MPYPHLQAELLMWIAGVMVFSGLWFPFCKSVLGRFGPWVQIPAAALPLVMLITVLVIFWKRARE